MAKAAAEATMAKPSQHVAPAPQASKFAEIVFCDNLCSICVEIVFCFEVLAKHQKVTLVYVTV